MTENIALTDAEMRALPSLLLGQIHPILGDHLVGFYLVGSLVTGDFDAATSDVDLIAVTSADVDEAEVARLDAMHAGLIRTRPNLDNRIEVIYIAAHHLNANGADYTIAEISPGEPFHVKEIHHDQWTINWLILREQSVTLYGLTRKRWSIRSRTRRSSALCKTSAATRLTGSNSRI